METASLTIIIAILIQINEVTLIDLESNKVVKSRKRRYLVFPEGASFQVGKQPLFLDHILQNNALNKFLVYDLTYPAIALQGNLITFGNTAAMAWELPTQPIFLNETKFRDDKTETTTVKFNSVFIDHLPETGEK